MVSAVGVLMAAMMALMAAPAIADGRFNDDDDGHFNRFGVGALDDDFRDDDFRDDDEDEEVDIERERVGNAECLLVIQEEGNEEELEDVVCFPRSGALGVGTFDPFVF
jgi:hypothetical protein